jgi:hypothetical protein
MTQSIFERLTHFLRFYLVRNKAQNQGWTPQPPVMRKQITINLIAARAMLCWAGGRFDRIYGKEKGLTPFLM